jgi:hypothetical protein
MSGYGRDLSNEVGLGALMLNSDLPMEQKRKLMIGMIQLGIDNYAVIRQGGNYKPNGGHQSGRLIPILMAGALLQNENLLTVRFHDFGAAVSRDSFFGETGQTFYIGETATNFEGTGYVLADAGLPEWGIRASYNPSQNDRDCI